MALSEKYPIMDGKLVDAKPQLLLRLYNDAIWN